MNTATKTKRMKITELRPPRDIVNNTKARRAWLAEQLAIVQAMPNRDGKIVGTGSYQVVSVYEVTEVAGRLRLRGICQFCGNSQVSQDGVLVLHGYVRPGDGHVYGKCPGMSQPALQLQKTLTEGWHAQFTADYDAAVIAATKADRAEYAALLSPARQAENAPHLPPLSRRATPEQRETHERAAADWRTRFPHAARYQDAVRTHTDARAARWDAEKMAKHFTQLLASGVHGTALVQEVVT